MILKESEIDSDTIESVLGKPYKEPGKWFTVTGSSYYFIKELTTISGENVLIWEDSKGIFQRYEHGLALLINRSNYQRVVLIPVHTINTLALRVENISPGQFLKAVSKILLALGLKYFSNFETRETILEFSTTEYTGRLITSYSSFKSQKKYFQKMGFLND